MTELSNKSIPYNAWLQLCVPEICNLSCVYCSSGQNDNVFSTNRKKGESGKINVRRIGGIIRKVFRFGITTAFFLYRQQRKMRDNKMPPMDARALLKSLEKTGRIFRVGISGGGEPLLIPNIVDACVTLSKKHYIAINTNLTSLRVREMAERIDPARMEFHASLHIKELERRKLLDRYIENYLLCRERGFIINAQEVAHPSMMPEVDNYRKLFGERGVEISFGEFKGEYLGKTYPDSYTDEEIGCFGLKQGSSRDIYRQKGKYCNAGYNVAYAGPDGLVMPCADIHEHMGHIYGGFHFQKNIRKCPVEICGCPFNEYDKPLFWLALSECNCRL